MKKILFLSLAITLFGVFTTNAQMIGSDVFIKGDFVEIGVSNFGYYGSADAPPTGYHPRPASRLGFVADPVMDGWAVGAPDYIGDYFVPGSPQEGFDIMADGVWNRAWGQSMGFTTGAGPLLLTGANTGYAVIGNKKYGYWNGTMGNLSIEQTTVLDTSRVYFLIDYKLKNTGTAPITNIYFERTVDPDNEVEVPGGSSFTTTNEIVFQPDGLPGGDDKCLVSAKGLNFPDISYLGLAAVDCRAKAYIMTSGLSPSFSIDNIYQGTTSYLTGIGNTNELDVGIGVIFNIGTLDPGDSAVFSFAYILREADIDSAFNTLTAKWNITGAGGEIIDGDTLQLCRGGEFPISITGGDAYEWGDWYPPTGLAVPSGRDNVITVPNETTTWYVIGTNPVCLQTDTLFITVEPIGDTTSINHTMCAGNTYNFNGTLLFNSGQYTQTYPTSLLSCDSVVILNLTVNPRPDVTLSAPLTNICEGETSLLMLQNPTNTATYNWYKNGAFLIADGGDYQYTATTSGSYFVIGRSPQNCYDTSQVVNITVNPAATAQIETMMDGVICIGDTIDLNAKEFSNYEYRWSPEKYFRYTTGYRTPEVIGVMSDSINIVVLTTMNEFGCTARDTLLVNTRPCCEILIPSAFSPNSDGNNDNFNIFLQPGQKILSFQIFDRLGNRVYDNQSLRSGWNGNINNGDVPAAQAVYMYRVLYSCTDGSNYEKKGDITLIR